MARRRYEAVEPDNRSVAAELERRWESALQSQRKVEEAFHRHCQERPSRLTIEQREAIVALCTTFPPYGMTADLPVASIDRQIIIRSLIDQIVVEVLDGTERVSVAIHWAGGFESHHEIRWVVSRFERLEAADDITKRIQELLDEGYRLSDIADQLNREGYCPARGEKFTKTFVGVLCRKLRRLGEDSQVPCCASEPLATQRVGQTPRRGAINAERLASPRMGTGTAGWSYTDVLGRPG